MTKIFQLFVKNERVVAGPAAEPVRSIIGKTVVSLNTVRQRMLNSSCLLRQEIERLTEELRQTDATVASLDLAISHVADDPALEADEREAACNRLDAQLANLVIDDDLIGQVA